ncbi:hypothetical protein [Chryseosolibacter indicus]|uniref:Uncharacterized protein n=1 Tax=Chryseosolibacter indicus TaxID=2782351 RepID=A0ABS5VZ75_9BACT|nr:hypothetical protein [Chryseosolibacter indicus]MBT1706373.1 hypothetical protein [Chryseosolibacter indicus]
MRKDEVKSAAIVSRISRELNLTSEQQAKVHEIVKTRWKSIANVKALRKQVDYTAINQDALNEVRKVLTPQQFEQLMSLQRQRAIQRKDFLEKHPDYAFSAEDKDLDF